MATRGKSNQPATEDEPFQDLMEAFNFTAKDLQANNDGLISQSQRDMLKGMGKRLTGYSRFGIKFMMVFVLIAFGAFLAFVLSNESSRKAFFGDTSALVVLAIVIPIPVLIMVGYYFVTKKQRRQYENAKLKIAEGRASLKQKSSNSRYGPNYYWELKIGAFEMHLLDEWAAVLKDGCVYRVNYAKVGRFPLILSIEETG
ncbi:MAG: hypothetical protein M1455_11665 [Actinobacteria bacterium]|nr:hypothetical protein [Actinomycetota bacterium]